MPETNLAVIDKVLAAYVTVADVAVQNIRPEVMWMFGTLTVLGMTWQHIKNMAEGKAHPIGLLFGQLIVIGIFVWLLSGYTYLMNAFYLSMIKLGLLAGGKGGIDAASFGNPSSLLKMGMDISKPLYDAMGFVGWFTGTNLIIIVSFFVILVAFFIMSFQVFVAILEFKLGVIFCFFMIALGTLKQTSFAAEKAIGYIFASGMKLFALATITSVGTSAIFELLKFSDSPTYNEAVSVAFGSLTIAFLTWFGPAKIAGVVSGGPSLGAGSMFATAAAFASMAGGAASTAVSAGSAVASGTAAAANAARSMGVADAIGGAMKTGASNLANTPAGRATIASATQAAAKVQDMASAAMPKGPAGVMLQRAGGRVAQTFRDAAVERAERASRGSSGNTSEAPKTPANDGISSEMKENPVLTSDALERMNRIEKRHDAARSANGGATTAATEHARAQAFRGIAHDVGSALSESNPALSRKIGSELDRIEGAGQAMAKKGVSPHQNSKAQAEEYKNVVNRALNLDGGGGYDKAQLTQAMTPEGQKQNSAALASLGVAQQVRSMAARGMSNREISNALGDKLKPLDVQAGRLGQSDRAGELKLQTIADFKSVNGIPGRNDAGFSEWAKRERKAMAAAAPVKAPSWAANAPRFKAPNIRSFIPNGTERGGGITASGSTPSL